MLLIVVLIDSYTEKILPFCNRAYSFDGRARLSSLTLRRARFKLNGDSESSEQIERRHKAFSAIVELIIWYWIFEFSRINYMTKLDY